MEECIEELACSQKTMLKLFTDLSDHFKATIKTIKVEIAEMKMQVNLMMRAVGNPTLNQACNVLSRLKISKPKAFNGKHNAKGLEIFIFDIWSNTLRLVELILKKPR
ncbi:uncharacterized protein E5676_scaffold447G001170 [Cucumis melo var. makuwa]|nr:uncharacterized protein E5676_scaffold447G001170 [Cucumis melo var. makuwa]